MRLFFIAVTLMAAGAALGQGHYYVTDAWSWGADNPLNLTPQQIANRGLPQSHYTKGPGSDEAKIKTLNGVWAKKTTPNNFKKHYVYFFWNSKPAHRYIFFWWRVAVQGGAKVKLYYWDGNSWEKISENGGTESPGSWYDRVDQYFNGQYLHLLAVGNTKPGNKWPKCDIGILEVSQ